MKTFTIGWLNKCRCGNKSHTVKTARGNNAGLWDDDAVKCNSCGRGGVIQVYEGQARVLWETDEEMAEGNPMSTITKQWLQKAISQHESMRDEIPFGLDEDDSNTLAALRIALASLVAEPAIHRWRRVTSEPYGPYPWHYGDFIGFSKPVDGIEDEYFYSAPPAPAPAPAPAKAEPVAWLWSHRKHPSEVSLVRPEDDERAEGAHWSGWSCQALYAAQPASAAMKDHQIRELVNELRDIAVEYHGTQQLRERIARTIRAAMLHGADGNSPVIPDGWVMVPEEPTHEMLEAGDEQFGTYDVYRRMIAAALQQEVKP